jgi:excisionase family DNA binding protein
MVITKEAPAEAHSVSPYLTKAEVAQLLRCNERYVEKQVAAGKLKQLRPTFKFARFRLSDIDEFMSGAIA